MASSGTFTSGRYGNQYGPWLTLAWTQVSQSVANNTTTLDLTLRFHWDRNISLSFNNKGGSLQGHAYTASGSASGTSGSRVLKTQRVTISHNSNGARSVTLSGNITKLNLSWSGIRVNTMSVSGTATLNTIPRASTLSAFSFNANLKNGTANQIKYTIDRKSTVFRHHIELRDGNTVLRTWDNIDSNGASTLTLTATEVNTLLNRMSKSTTRSYTLRVRTRSGNNGGWIGGAVSRNATATVDGTVKPSVSAVTLSQSGNPITTHTLQGFSKIKASFTRSAGYGASISSSSIQVRRRSGGADSQTINSNDGTTSNPVALNGVYEARGTTRDSRGRTTHTAWATITVTAYSAPTITSFSAVRNGTTATTATTVNISRATTHTVLGTSNDLTYTIQRRQGTGAWANVNTGATGSITTSGATGSATSTGNAVTSSYEFRLVVTDKLGRSAESLQSVSTQRVVLDIHKNEGVGIGKIHERGVLDVDGEIFLRGSMEMTGKPTGGPAGNDFHFVMNPDYGNSAIELGSLTTASTPFIDFHSSGAGNDRDVRILAKNGWGNAEGTGDLDIVANIVDFLVRSNVRVNGDIIVNTGNNGNGSWVRFYDGTQICWNGYLGAIMQATDLYGEVYASASLSWTFPMSFISIPAILPSMRRTAGGAGWAGHSGGTSVTAVTALRILSTHNSTQGVLQPVAIGRWK